MRRGRILDKAKLDAKPESVVAVGVNLVESYFSDAGGRPEVGTSIGDRLLDVEKYVKTRDEQGNILPVEFYWGSTKTGFPERKTRAGYIEAKVNPKTKELDWKNGRRVEIRSPDGKASSILLVRHKEDGDRRRAAHEAFVLRTTQRMPKAEMMDRAKEFGLEENLDIAEPTITEVIVP